MRSASSEVSRSAVAVYASLGAQVAAMAALVVFEHVRGRRLSREIAAIGGDPHNPAAREMVGAVTVFAVLMLLLAGATVTAAVAYLSWLRRVRPASSGLYAIGAWLVPGVNLVAPPIIADQAWREAARGRGNRSRWLPLLVGWWVSWLALIWLVLVRLPRTRGPADLTGVGLLELVTAAVAAALCAATVHRITGFRGLRAVAASRHRPRVRVGPELPELACQSRRWGSAGWARKAAASRTPGAGPISE